MKTLGDVRLFLAALNRPKVGTKVLCGNKDHTSPFDILAALLLETVRYAVIWGSRSGSKTYLFGGLDTYYKSVTKKNYTTRILGGSEGQALYTYQAIGEFSQICDPDGRLVKRLMAQKAEFKDNSKVSILPASLKSVRGAHQQCLKLDEVDEIDSEVYEAALSQPQSLYGHPASLIMFSTNHNINGQMDTAIQRAAERGHSVFKYCVWETVESCKDFNCSTCKLSSVCPDPTPNSRMKTADGYYKIEDLIEKLGMISSGMFSRDWLCVKVGMGDTVYDQEWVDQIWDEKDCPEGNLVIENLRDAPVVLSLDFGGIDPFSIGVWQKAEKGAPYGDDTWVRITELWLTAAKESATNPQFIELAKSRPWAKLVKEIIPDSGRPDLIQEWRTAFPRAKITLADKKSIDEGVEATKDALAPVSGYPKVFATPRCAHIRQEMQTYVVKNDKPVDKHNHACDEFRYFVMAKVKRVRTGYFGIIDTDIMPR